MEKNNFKIELTKYNTYALAIKFKNATEDLTSAYFTVKENPDDVPMLQKALGTGIIKIDDKPYKTEKTYKLQLEALDTKNFEIDVQYLYDLQVTVGSVVKTVISGFFVVKQSVTGYPQTSSQDLEVAVVDEVEAELLVTPTTNGIDYEVDPIALEKIGDMSKLNTTNKQNVVGAVNELKTSIDKNKQTTDNSIANIEKNITEIEKQLENTPTAKEIIFDPSKSTPAWIGESERTVGLLKEIKSGDILCIGLAGETITLMIGALDVPYTIKILGQESLTGNTSTEYVLLNITPSATSINFSKASRKIIEYRESGVYFGVTNGYGYGSLGTIVRL